MRRIPTLLASAAAAAGLFAALGPAPLGPAPAAAEFGCPSQMTPAPAAFVRQGDRKDHNGNTLVCATPTTCVQASGPICHGGPDDDIYGSVPLLGSDGEWYYVVDDV